MVKKLIFVVILFCNCLVWAVPTYSPSQMDVIQKRGYLRVGILNQQLDPFVIFGANNSLSGIDIDLAYQIGDLLQVKVRFDRSAKTYDDLLRLVYDKKVDVALSGIIRTPSRARSVRFSQAYYTYPAGLLINRIKYDHLNGNIVTAFNSPTIKIGTLEGGAFIGYVQYLYPKAQMVLYDTSEKMLNDVISDKVDACMMDELVVRKWLSQKPERALRTRYITIPDYHASYAIATSYDYKEFGEWLSVFVDEAQAVGITQRLLIKYMGTSNVTAQ